MRHICKFLTVVLILTFCLLLVACAPDPIESKGESPTTVTTPAPTTPEETTPEETTPEETTPEETTPEKTTPVVTEPDFSNTPDPDGTKRY